MIKRSLIISAFLVLTGIYGGSVSAGQIFWIVDQIGWAGTKVPARKFSSNESQLSDDDKRVYVKWMQTGAPADYDSALALSPKGWAAGFGSNRVKAKQAALRSCKKKLQSNSCKIVDEGGKSAFLKQKSSTGSTATASSSDKIWCATSNSVTNVSRSQCKTGNGNAFTSKYQANAENKRLKTALQLAKKKADEEAARKLAKKKAEEEAARRLAKKKAEEEAARKLAKKKAEEEAAKKKAEEEAAKKKAEEDAKKKE